MYGHTDIGSVSLLAHLVSWKSSAGCLGGGGVSIWREEGGAVVSIWREEEGGAVGHVLSISNRSVSNRCAYMHIAMYI